MKKIIPAAVILLLYLPPVSCTKNSEQQVENCSTRVKLEGYYSCDNEWVLRTAADNRIVLRTDVYPLTGAADISIGDSLIVGFEIPEYVHQCTDPLWNTPGITISQYGILSCLQKINAAGH
jgi:hypothetical protein